MSDAEIITVAMTDADHYWCRFIGKMRNDNALRHNYDGAHGGPADGEREHYRGALAELGASKWFDLAWTDWLNVGGIDVGDEIDVRSSTYYPTHGMPIHDKDIEEKPNVPFVMADRTGLPDVIRLWGYFYPKDAEPLDKTNPTGNGRPPARWVPLPLLRPCLNLRRYVHWKLARK